ncbi:MAG: hypothetical protein ACLS9K_12820 [Lachnospira eligens]
MLRRRYITCWYIALLTMRVASLIALGYVCIRKEEYKRIIEDNWNHNLT